MYIRPGESRWFHAERSDSLMEPVTVSTANAALLPTSARAREPGTGQGWPRLGKDGAPRLAPIAALSGLASLC